jgi:hypothetical protein
MSYFYEDSMKFQVFKGMWQGKIPVALKKLKNEHSFNEFVGELSMLRFSFNLNLFFDEKIC